MCYVFVAVSCSAPIIILTADGATASEQGAGKRACIYYIIRTGSEAAASEQRRNRLFVNDDNVSDNQV